MDFPPVLNLVSMWQDVLSTCICVMAQPPGALPDPMVVMNPQVQINARAVQFLGMLRVIAQRRRRRRNRRPRQFWVRPWILRRNDLGFYDRLMQELENESPTDFKNMIRMDPPMFRELLARLTPRISKQDTNYRPAIKPGVRLAVTLKYLATGETYHSLSFAFRVPHNTISQIIKDVCQAIIDEYANEVVDTPTSPDDWKLVARNFSSRWNFDHCLGALDGKHVAITKPNNSGSEYFNYKGFFSIILLALVDADYKIIWADVGTPGATSDAAVFNNSDLKDAVESEDLDLPEPEPLQGDNEDISYFFIADDAFALKTWLMKPFAKRNLTREERIFNYWLSRARRVVENAFGILANRFQVFLTTMRQQPHTVRTICLACICLHNLMRLRYPRLQNEALDAEDENHHVIPGAWRQHANLHDMDEVFGGNQGNRRAKQQRLLLKHYYNSETGQVAWQNDML